MFEGVYVLELASVLAGPMVGMFFAELGATVVKVENLQTQGDVTRSWKLNTEPSDTDISAYFSCVNWGKQSIAIDLKQQKGRELVYACVRKADIVISSFLPASAKRLQVDADTLQQINPRAILAEINGYGREESRAAFDAMIQAEAGFTFMNGLKEKGIYKMPVALMDVLTGHQLKEAILLAYIRRMQTGRGERVSASLIESGVSSLVNQATNWLVARHIPQAIGSEHPNIVPYGTIFQTKDGKQIVLAVGNDKQFASLGRILRWEFQEEYVTNSGRVKYREEVLEKLSVRILEWNRKDLLQTLIAHKIPAGAVNSIPDVFELPQSQSLLIKSEGYTGVRTFAARGDAFRQNLLHRPPHLSEHTDSILHELGKTSADIQYLREQKVVL